MKLAIMQPYFLPYIGYFQLMNSVDKFVIYDNIEYTKKGWINRNRILGNGADALISLPLKKDSDYLSVIERFLADSWAADRVSMLNRIRESYRKSPQFNEVFPLVERCLKFENHNLFHFIFNAIQEVKTYLGITTPLVVSSTVKADHSLKSEQKVLDICRVMGATTYINPIGGLDLYQKPNFNKHGIELSFIKPENIQYTQFKEPFVPRLSILDVMMFNTSNDCSQMLRSFRLLSGDDIDREIRNLENTSKND